MAHSACKLFVAIYASQKRLHKNPYQKDIGRQHMRERSLNATLRENTQKYEFEPDVFINANANYWIFLKNDEFVNESNVRIFAIPKWN